MANKLAPSIIFIDEIDCFMRTRSVMEQDHVVRVKTEFMTLWDGLLTGTLHMWYNSLFPRQPTGSVDVVTDSSTSRPAPVLTFVFYPKTNSRPPAV